MHFDVVKPFPITLWADAGAGRRSIELTALYVERFQGPRVFRHLWRHDYWELAHVINGNGEMRSTPPSRLPLTPGMTVLVPPGFAHNEVSKAPIDIIWVGLGGGRVEQLAADRLLAARDPDGRAQFEALWHLSRRGSGLIGPELDGLALAVFSRLLRHLAEGVSPGASRVDRAIRLFNEQYATDLPMPDVAAELGWSEGHFYRAFKERTGRTPVEFLRDVRIRQARHWLENSDLSVARIAALVGFRDARYFARVFRACTGTAPNAARAVPARPRSRTTATARTAPASGPAGAAGPDRTPDLTGA